MLSAVNLVPVIIGSVACGSDSAVLLAAADDEPAETTEARVELAGAWLVRVVAVAAVVVLVSGSLEYVVGPLERCEFGAPVLELHTEFSNSGSCGCASVIHAAFTSCRKRSGTT